MIKVGHSPVNESVHYVYISSLNKGDKFISDDQVYTFISKSKNNRDSYKVEVEDSNGDRDFIYVDHTERVELSESLDTRLRPSITKTKDYSYIKKGEWVVVNIEPRLVNKANLVPVKIDSSPSKYGEFSGWTHGERMHQYNASSVNYVASSESDAKKFIDANKGKTVKELLNGR